MTRAQTGSPFAARRWPVVIPASALTDSASKSSVSFFLPRFFSGEKRLYQTASRERVPCQLRSAAPASTAACASPPSTTAAAGKPSPPNLSPPYPATVPPAPRPSYIPAPRFLRHSGHSRRRQSYFDQLPVPCTPGRSRCPGSNVCSSNGLGGAYCCGQEGAAPGSATIRTTGELSLDGVSAGPG